MKNTKEISKVNDSYKLVVIGPNASFPEKDKVNVGDIITIKKEESQIPGAISAYFNGVRVGLLGVAKNTLPEGCQSAAEVAEFISEESQCIVTKLEEVVFKGASTEPTKALVIKVPKKGEVLQEVTDAKYGKKERTLTYKAKVGGPKRGNAAKYSVLAALNAGENPEVNLEVLEGNVLVYFDGVKAGNIIPSEDKSSPVEIAEILENAISYKAKAISPEVTSFEIEVTVTTEVVGKEVLVEDLLKTGLLSEDKIDQKLDYLSSLSINQKNITEIFNVISDDRPKTIDRIPTGDMVFKNANRIMESLIIGMNAGSNLRLEGPKASGKNTAIEDLGRLYEMPIYEVQINSQTDNETLLGSKTIKASNNSDQKDEINKCIRAIGAMFSGREDLESLAKSVEENPEQAVGKAALLGARANMDFTPLINAIRGGETEIEFEPSALVLAMEEGGIVVFDEINTGHPEVLAILNSVLDKRRRLDVPGYGLVQAHPRFRVFCTMNKDYQGTFEMNEATASRFSTVVFEVAKSIQDIIKSNCPDIDETSLKICDKVYKSMVKLTKDAKASGDILNVRAFIDACAQVEWGQPIKEALTRNVAHACSDLDDRQAVEQIIDLNLG